MPKITEVKPVTIDNIHEIENGIYFTFHQILSSLDLITIKEYHQLTIDLCQKIGAKYIIRGVRNTIDFEYEKLIFLNNHIYIF